MSEHAIEDWVEDCVRLVDEGAIDIAAKRRLFAALYHYQSHFDTSYTVFRVVDILIHNGYLALLPIDRHPDIEQLKAQLPAQNENGWLPAQASDPDGDMMYVFHRDGSAQFVVQWGTALWQRLADLELIYDPEDNEPVPALPNLILHLLQLAEKKDDQPLLQDIYLSWVNAILEYSLDDQDGISAHFRDWEKDATLQSIREFLVRHQLLKKKHQYSEFVKPSLKEELELETDPDRIAILQYLLDPKKSVKQLSKSYDKQFSELELLPQKADIVEQVLSPMLQKAGWTPLAREGFDLKSKRQHWCWYQDVLEKASGQTHRLFTEISLDFRYGELGCVQSVQHELICQWQGKSLTLDLNDIHFSETIGTLLPKRVLEKNPYLKIFDLWDYSPRRSMNALRERAQSLGQAILSVGTRYLDFIASQFPGPFFDRPLQTYIDWFDSDGAMPKELINNYLYNIMLLYAYHEMQEGHREQAIRVAKTLEARLPEKFKSLSHWYRDSLRPALEELKAGKCPTLPPLHSRYNHNL